jgi:hypothetical protein
VNLVYSLVKTNWIKYKQQIRVHWNISLNSATTAFFHDSSIVIATGWTVGIRTPVRAREFSLLNNVQTGSGAHPDSYQADTGDCYSGGKEAGDVKLTTHLHLVPKSKMMELCVHSPIRLHGLVLNQSQRELWYCYIVHLVPRSRKRGSIHPLPHTPSWRSA